MLQKKLSRKIGHRSSLIRNLCVSLVLHEHVVTTEAKGKLLKSRFDRLVRTAKKADLASRRKLIAVLDSKPAAYKLIDDIAKRKDNRTSGHTRIFKLDPRLGDGGNQVLVRLTDQIIVEKKKASDKKEEVNKTEEKDSEVTNE